MVSTKESEDYTSLIDIQRGHSCCETNPVSTSGQRWNALKMIMFPFLPATILIVTMTIALVSTLDTKTDLEVLGDSMSLLEEIGELVHMLQRELEVVTLFLGSTGSDNFTTLQLSFESTDDALKALTNWPTIATNSTVFDTSNDFQLHIESIRESVISRNVTIPSAIKIYEEANIVFVNWFTEHLQELSHNNIWRDLLAFKFITRAKENTVIMLSYGQEFLLKSHMPNEDRVHFITNDALATDHLQSCFHFNPATNLVYVKGLQLHKIDLSFLSSLKTMIIDGNDSVANGENAFAWFSNATGLLEVFKDIEEFVVEALQIDLRNGLSLNNTQVSELYILFLSQVLEMMVRYIAS